MNDKPHPQGLAMARNEVRRAFDRDEIDAEEYKRQNDELDRLAGYTPKQAERASPDTSPDALWAYYTLSIFRRAEAARVKAQAKFPQPNYTALKVAEEAGELVKAAVHYAEDRETWQNVEAEAVQTIAMILRLLIEGDGINGVKPPPLHALAAISMAGLKKRLRASAKHMQDFSWTVGNDERLKAASVMTEAADALSELLSAWEGGHE
jgi:hypothetical protein